MLAAIATGIYKEIIPLPINLQYAFAVFTQHEKDPSLELSLGEKDWVK